MSEEEPEKSKYDHDCNKDCPYFTIWRDADGIKRVGCKKQQGM